MVATVERERVRADGLDIQVPVRSDRCAASIRPNRLPHHDRPRPTMGQPESTLSNKVLAISRRRVPAPTKSCRLAVAASRPARGTHEKQQRECKMTTTTNDQEMTRDIAAARLTASHV